MSASQTPAASPQVPRRIASTIVNSLKGGVVPRVGLPYITVGREAEIGALLHDLDLIADGGASFRFLVGRYGSGKSFLLQTIRNHAMGRNFVVADADLSPERRLQGTKGQGLATYRELIRNLSTKTRPEGGALTLVLDRWISNVQSDVALSSGLRAHGPGLLCRGGAPHPRGGTLARGARPRLRLRAPAHALLPLAPQRRRRDQGQRGQVVPRRVPHQGRGQIRARREHRDYRRRLVRLPQAFCRLPQGSGLPGAARARRRAGEPLQDPERGVAPVQLPRRSSPCTTTPSRGAPPTWAS